MNWNETINKIDELDNKLLIPKEGNLEKANLKETFKTMTNDDFETFYEVLKERDEHEKEIERLNYKIKSIVYMCYESDMSYDEFKQVWVNAFDKIYDPNDVEILKKELKGSDKDENN